jgi:DNA-binding NarL/FixJ family response regulator
MALLGRVLIAHADPLARAYVRGIADYKLRVAGAIEADSFESLLAQLRDDQDVALVIVDLDLLGMSWEIGLRYLEMEYRDVRVAVLCGSADQDRIGRLSRHRNAAVIPKQLPEPALIEILGHLTGVDPHESSGPEAPMDQRSDGQLTSRQAEVLRLLSQGRSNREISQILGIAEGTVKVHVNAAFRILGVHNRVSATVAFRASPGAA